MFMGLNLTLQEQFFGDKNGVEKYRKIWKSNFKSKEDTWKKNLKKYILNETIDGSKLQGDWFPEINADIFISHSHQDERLAQALAGWLYDVFGIKSFIDSDRWGYIDELLEQLNDEYSDKDEVMGYRIYSYEKSNRVSQNVNTMLTIALHKMIDKTEAILLLNTDNSVKDMKGKKGITYSPWIYSEMVCSNIIRKKPLLAYRDYKINTVFHEDEMEKIDMACLSMMISYTMPIAHLERIDEKNLSQWKKEYEELKDEGLTRRKMAKIKIIYGIDKELDYCLDKQYPLDILYNLLKPNLVEESRRIVKDIPQNIIKQICEKEFDSNISREEKDKWEKEKIEQQHILKEIYEKRIFCIHCERREPCSKYELFRE